MLLRQIAGRLLIAAALMLPVGIPSARAQGTGEIYILDYSCAANGDELGGVEVYWDVSGDAPDYVQVWVYDVDEESDDISWNQQRFGDEINYYVGYQRGYIFSLYSGTNGSWFDSSPGGYDIADRDFFNCE